MSGLLDVIFKPRPTSDAEMNKFYKYAEDIYNQGGTLKGPSSPGELVLYKRAATKAINSGNFSLADIINNAILSNPKITTVSE